MTIDGGGHGERYSFHFEVSASGTVKCRFGSDLAGRRLGAPADRTKPVDLDDLLRRLDVSRLKQLRQARMPAIPPCSLVGRLEVFDGEQQLQIVFMADEGQARQAGYRMPPAVARAVDVLYDLGAKCLGLKGKKAIRP
jgi:hypothetical protein